MPALKLTEPQMSKKDAESLLIETDRMIALAESESCIHAIPAFLVQKRYLLEELQRHRKVSIEKKGAKVDDATAREQFLGSLPHLPLPLLEAAVSEYAKRSGIPINELKNALVALRRGLIREAV